MTIPPSDRHGFWVNHNGTPKLIHAAWVNHAGITKSAKEVWINNAGTPTRVFPPRAYVVELVPVGSRLGVLGLTAVDTTNTTINTSSADGLANIGNWNSIWGGVQQGGNKLVTFAFRRWDKYDANGHYDFSTANKVRRTTATGAVVGQGHGGLWKTLLQTSPYNPNDNRTHSPFVVIEPGSKLLCIRLGSAKTYSQGSGEAASGPMGTVTLVSGNAIYFGSPTTTTVSFGSNAGTDVPSNQDQPIGLIVDCGSNASNVRYGIIASKGSHGKFGVSTSNSYALASLNNGTWMTNKNYGSTPTSTFYAYDALTSPLTISASLGEALPALSVANTSNIGSGHVGWKYLTIDSDDSAASAGTSYYNFNMTNANFTADRSLGSTLFLVIPP